jgi:hypothetical protein
MGRKSHWKESTSTPHVFMVSAQLITHRDNFTFYLYPSHAARIRRAPKNYLIILAFLDSDVLYYKNIYFVGTCIFYLKIF